MAVAGVPSFDPERLRTRPAEPAGAPKRGMSKRWKRLLIAGGIVLAIVLIGLIPYPYQTGGPFQFLPTRRVEVRSEVEGLVETILVKEGQWIEAGQPIARLTRRVHEKNLNATQAQLEEARAQLALIRAGAKPEEVERAEAAVNTAQTSLAWSGPRATRYVQLHKDKMISDQEYENALRQRDLDSQALEEAKANLKLVKSGARRQEIEALEAQVRSLEALVKNYRTDVERTTLTSPIAGRVVTPRIEDSQGAYLKPGQRDLVATIEDARNILAEVEVPEEDTDGVRVGSEVKIVTWAFHNRVFHGRVVSIAPAAATNSVDTSNATVVGEVKTTAQVTVASSTYRVVRVMTEIPNGDGLLKSEMTGFAKIATSDRPVWDVLLRPILRWIMVEVWYWIP